LDKEEIQQNKYTMEKLEELIGSSGGGSGGNSINETAPEREIYREEQAKIDEWKDEINDQV